MLIGFIQSFFKTGFFTAEVTAERRWTMRPRLLISCLLAAPVLITAPSVAAFVSGSTGIHGPFSPTVDTEVPLPDDGVFNFTSVNIPLGVTVRFARNTINTPVTILATEDVTIAGVVEVSGFAATDSGPSGDGNLGDDRIPGAGGPGGFNGGFGGIGAAANRLGGKGLGPGGGNADKGTAVRGGGGGGFGSPGGRAAFSGGLGGGTYGSPTLLPLIGGSGGGGGEGGSNFDGGGGGGGGGAVLIASSGTIDLTGSIIANGRRGGNSGGAGQGAGGGGGSGGAVRLIATTIRGNGTIHALGGGGGDSGQIDGGNGGSGRIRLEAEIFERTAGTNPGFTFAAPGDVFVAGLPALRVARVAGVDVPLQPTGDADITLPATTPNPVTVEFETSGVPVGNTVTLQVAPRNDLPTTAVSDALAGTEASATASVVVDLPEGPSTLSASVSFTVTASIGDALKNFAEGERVERIELAAAPGQGSTTTLITVSGKRYTWPSNAVAMN